MKSERIAALFAAALELPEAERAAFLSSAQEEPREVRDEVARLLAAHAAADGFLEGADAAQAAALVESVREPTQVGRRIGPYRVTRELGRGGMGVVYLAVRTEEDFDQRVALKVIRGGPVSENVLRRFIRERRILAGIEHPGVARLLDGGVTEEGDPFFAMEYVEGEPLTSFCDHRRLSIEERLRLFVNVCRTVQYAHGNLVVHRDLKPSNILVTAEGTTKLLDFGIAKLLDESADASEPLTREGHQALTPEYAAPEQVRGEQVTTATDVYSLGVLLYKLLTGRRPYQVEGLAGDVVAKAVCETEPQAPSAAIDRVDVAGAEDAPGRTSDRDDVSRRRGLPPARLKRRLAGDLDTVVLKALRKQPARRYGSAEALADDLERHLGGLPVRARPDTVRYRTSKFIRRHRLGVASAALVGISLAAGLAGTAWQAKVAAGERDRAEREAARAGEVKDYVLSLFEASDPAESKGAAVTARELLDRGAEYVGVELAEQPDLQAEMLEVIGGVNLSLGEYEPAKELFERALALRRSVGSDPLAVAGAVRLVAEARHALGDYHDAESLYREALEIQRIELGDQSAEVGLTLSMLGVTLAVRGDYAEADPLYRQALEIQRRELGEEHPDTIVTLASRATLLVEMGDYEAAEPLEREALELQRRVLGAEHPKVALEMSSLAATLSYQGKYEEAVELHRQALAMRRKLLGDEHPRVGSSLNNLAAVLRKQGNFEDAEALNRQVLELDRKALGGEHLWVAMDLDNLGVVVAEQGRLEEGFEFLSEAQAMYLRLIGARSQHPAVGRMYQGVIRGYQGRGDEAERMLNESLEVLRATVGPETPRVAAALGHLAEVQAERGEHEAAREGYAEALRIQRQALRPGHPDVVLTLVGLGEAHLALGQSEEAERHLREGLELAESAFPEGHWRVSLAQSALGEVLSRRGHQGAGALLLSGYEGLRSIRGDWHPATRRALRRLSTSTES